MVYPAVILSQNNCWVYPQRKTWQIVVKFILGMSWPVRFEIKPLFIMLFREKKFELSPRLRLGVGRGYSQNQILKFAAILCLVLALGLTANAFRLVFKNSKQPPSGSFGPQVLGASDIQQGGSQNSLQFTSYTVKKGDTLFNISQKFNIDWTTLAALNNLKSPFYLKPDQTLQVPKQ